MLEKKLRKYLTYKNGINLKYIDPELLFLKEEYAFYGGRIDILAMKNGVPVGIELKAKDYNSMQVAAQLLNYINFLAPKSGEVYFIAPKVKEGIFSSLKAYQEITSFFEYDNQLRFRQVYRTSRKKVFEIIFPEIEEDWLYKTFRKPIVNGVEKLMKKMIGL